MLEEAASKLGITEQQIFREACISSFAPGFAINPEKVYECYCYSGFIPYFVTDYIREVLDEVDVPGN